MSKDFDLVLVKLGYRTYTIPKAAALKLFDAFIGQDIYAVDDHWESTQNGGKGGTATYAKLVEQGGMPTLTTIGPVSFHIALENQRRKEEEEATKNASTT